MIIVDYCEKESVDNGLIWDFSEESMIREWKAHNVAYNCSIFVDNSKSVDFTPNESPLRRFMYCLVW